MCVPGGSKETAVFDIRRATEASDGELWAGGLRTKFGLASRTLVFVLRRNNHLKAKHPFVSLSAA